MTVSMCPLLSPHRYFWEEPGPVCLSVHHSLPGPAHLIHIVIQHNHEGETLKHYSSLYPVVSPPCSSEHTQYDSLHKKQVDTPMFAK